jgi:hypothetical protein
VRSEGKRLEGFVELTWSDTTDVGIARPGGQELSLVKRLVRTVGGTFCREVDAGWMKPVMRLPTI